LLPTGTGPFRQDQFKHQEEADKPKKRHRLRRGGVRPLIVVHCASDASLAAYVCNTVPDAHLAAQRERLGIADALCQALALLGTALQSQARRLLGNVPHRPTPYDLHHTGVRPLALP